DVSHIFEKYSINPEPTIKANGKQYELELSDLDMKTQTLIKFKDVYAQVYVDQQTNEVVAVRYLDSEALTAFKPYQTLSSEEDEEVKNKYGDVSYEQNSNQLMRSEEHTSELQS